MSITRTLQISYPFEGNTIRETISRTADGADPRSFTVADGTTNLIVNWPVDVSAVAMLFISSDKAITIKTNSNSAPDNTLSVPANEPVFWYSGSPLANPLTVDVVTLHIANSSGATATVSIDVAQDTTP